MVEVPRRLLRQGRQPDPRFLPSERLFRRIHPDHLEGGQVLSAAIPFPDFSVNREKYSIPEDVLLDHTGFGILAFQVRDVPPRLDGADDREFTFKVEHVPEEENYAHSEVRTYCDGERTSAKPPKALRAEFRLRLCAAGRVLVRPDIGP